MITVRLLRKVAISTAESWYAMTVALPILPPIESKIHVADRVFEVTGHEFYSGSVHIDVVLKPDHSAWKKDSKYCLACDRMLHLGFTRIVKEKAPDDR